MTQDCLLYKSLDGNDAILVMLPQLSSRTEEAIPFYHPQVAGLAFRYFSFASRDSDDTIDKEVPSGRKQLDYLPLQTPDVSDMSPERPYWAEDTRTFRTALQLLSLVVRHGKSKIAETSYVKRVHHDIIVPKVVFQDLYAKLKEKYIWILREWKEVTDPAKHVFEVIDPLTSITIWPEDFGC